MLALGRADLAPGFRERPRVRAPSAGLDRSYVGFDLSEPYCAVARRRIEETLFRSEARSRHR